MKQLQVVASQPSELCKPINRSFQFNLFTLGASMSLLIWSRFWGFETPSWIQKLQEPIAEPVASNSWIDWLHWTGSSLVVATGCTKMASNAYYRVLSIRPSNYSCTYIYIYTHTYMSNIKYKFCMWRWKGSPSINMVSVAKEMWHASLQGALKL